MDVLQAKILDPTHLELSEPIGGRPGESIQISINQSTAPGGRSFDRPDAQTPPPSAGRRALPPRHREREQAWRRSHDEVLQGLAGQWVVL